MLKRAKGLAIVTVLKAGFLFSGRAGSGVIVARLENGSWSAPSAIAMVGAGAGGMIGVELTDFVFILNTADAVKSFSQFGSITLGGNISVAAGPLGRNAEAAAAASTSGIAAVFSYSKTKGLFAGISLEGSVIVERREANRKFYGNNCTAKMILSGHVDPPPAVDPLFCVLESRVFNMKRNMENENDDDFYDDIPSNYDSDCSDLLRNGRSKATNSMSYYDDDDYDCNDVENYYSHARAKKASSSWEDDVYDSMNTHSDKINKSKTNNIPSIPKSEKPDFGLNKSKASPPRRPTSGLPKVVALYTFKGEQVGDLPFRKGDVITIIKKSNSQNDWWTGRVNGQEGIFPANYVELV